MLKPSCALLVGVPLVGTLSARCTGYAEAVARDELDVQTVPVSLHLAVDTGPDVVNNSVAMFTCNACAAEQNACHLPVARRHRDTTDRHLKSTLNFVASSSLPC